MSKFARIADGVVFEIIEVPPDGPSFEERYSAEIVAACVPVADGAEVDQGWAWDGEGFAAPTPPAAPVPHSIAATQFWLELPNWTAVTEEEALAGARTGAIPAAIADVLLALPSAAAFEAKVRLARMGDVLRADPLTEAIATGLGKTAEELDAFFRAAALR